MKNGFLTIQQKIEIVKEAYSAEGKVKSTAKEYGVTPRTIYRWKQLVDENGKPRVPKGMIQKHTRRTSPKLLPEYEEVLLSVVQNGKEGRKAIHAAHLQQALVDAFPDMLSVDSKKWIRAVVECFCKRHDIKLARTPRSKATVVRAAPVQMSIMKFKPDGNAATNLN